MLFLAIAVAIVLAPCIALAEESDMFVKSTPVVRVYTHRDGYKVVYEKNDLGVGVVYLPIDWFNSGGKGEVIYGTPPTVPYMSVFWADGKFSHIRLYVDRNMSGSSWGIIDQSENVADKFNIDTLEIEY